MIYLLLMPVVQCLDVLVFDAVRLVEYFSQLPLSHQHVVLVGGELVPQLPDDVVDQVAVARVQGLLEGLGSGVAIVQGHQ